MKPLPFDKKPLTFKFRLTEKEYARLTRHAELNQQSRGQSLRWGIRLLDIHGVRDQNELIDPDA